MITPEKYLEDQKLYMIDPLTGYQVTYSQLVRMLEEYYEAKSMQIFNSQIK